MNAPPWTPEEDAAIRRLCAPKKTRARRAALPWEALHCALPGRTRRAIHARYLMVVTRRPARRWTPAEDARLREEWRAHGYRTILAAFPGRTWTALVLHAVALGLPSVPQGWALLRRTYRRLGCSGREALSVIAWSEGWAPLVEAICEWGYQCAVMAARSPEHTGPLPECTREARWPAGAVPTRLHTTATSCLTTPKHRWTLVEEEAFEDALLRRLAWETTTAAATRLRVKRQALARLLLEQGWATLAEELPVRMPPAWWDACAAAAGLRSGGRSAAAHASARGIKADRVFAALAAAGVPTRGRKGARGYYLDAEVDAALAAYARRPGVVRATPKGAPARKAAAS